MKLQIVSDLHLQFWGNRGHTLEALLDDMRTEEPVDALVLAGDITELAPREYDHARRVFEQFCRHYARVLYVPGNHEFYETSIDEGLSNLFEIEKKLADTPANFQVLNTGRIVELCGKRILGATMWQPKPTAEEAANIRPISDHFCIKDFYKEAPREYGDWKKFLDANLRAGDIVITHHTPSYQSCAEQFLESDLNYWFHTPQVEPLIKERMPKLWIHGHTHTPFDYYLDSDTRVVCNPRGYPGEGVPFNPKLVVEV